MAKLTPNTFRLYVITGVLSRETSYRDTNLERLIAKAHELNADKKMWDKAMIYNVDGEEVWNSDDAESAKGGRAEPADAIATDD